MTWSDIAAIFETLERRLIASLKRNLQRHRDWEKQEGFNWSAWQAEKLKNAEAFRRQNKQIMDEYTDQIDVETRLLMEEQFREGYEHEEQVLAETGIPANPTMRSFFGVNARRVDSLIDDMLHVESKAESAALRMMDDVYRTTVAKAAAEMAVGSVTFQQAADNATRELLRTGINCIEYADGRRVNIADYVQMALRTAATRSYLQGEAKKREELGIDTVLVSQYGACSETCLPWQGDVYIDDVYGSFSDETAERSGGDKLPGKTLKYGKSRNGNWYPLLSEAIRNGLFHPNCRHTLSTWIEGVSRRPAPLDKKKVKETAKLEQQQRKMERKIREAKRMVTGLSDPEMQKQARHELRKRQKELKTFIDEHSDVLRRDYWKEKVYPEERAALKVQTKSDILEMFKMPSEYTKADGTFDVDAAFAEFQKDLQTFQEPFRTYYTYMTDPAANPVDIVIDNSPDVIWGYDTKMDQIKYNPKKVLQSKSDVTTAFTHEIAHRIDVLFFQSYKNADFQKAIDSYKAKAVAQSAVMEKYVSTDSSGFAIDIYNAISEGVILPKQGRPVDYWKRKNVKQAEVFADLFSLMSLKSDKLHWVEHDFPDIVTAFKKVCGI